jgi:phage shock protein C
VNPRRLYRSRNERVIAGVAGGMAEYLDVDPTVIRILWILATFLGGITILLYPIMVFIVPLAPAGTWVPAPGASGTPAEGGVGGESGQPAQPGPDGAPAGYIWTAPMPGVVRGEHRGPGAAVYLGVLLVVFGLFALADSVIPGWFGHASAGPAVIVALGAMLLVGAVRRPAVDR